MQAGHVPLALAIATYDWNPRMAVFCLAIHWLPNADSLVVKAGFAKPEFHCTVTHSVFFALVVSGVIAIFLAHYAADIGSTVGLPLLWPLSKRKFTLAFFKDTGYWGWDMLIGYYKQPMAWVLEGLVLAFFIYRLTVVSA